MSVNSSTQYRTAIDKTASLNANPEYSYWFEEWEKMRDCVLGQKQIKAMAKKYLPSYAKMTKDEYQAYLQRSSFYNMTSRTLDGMIGTAFLRNPKVLGLDESLVPELATLSKKRSPFLILAKQVCEEILKVGRVGALCDMSSTGGETPYLSPYLAENILDWRTSVVDGRDTLTYVLLREVSRNEESASSTTQYDTIYRILLLEDGVYRQEVYTVADVTNPVDFANTTPDEVIVPRNRGASFNRIPFVFFGPRSNETEVEKPPLLDIADINLSHYQSGAQLEQGRWYTGLPIYYAEVASSGQQAEYDIAPNTVWQVTTGAKAGIIEFNGQGLKFLENALIEKENQISALGGRMITNRPDSTGKSVEETRMNDRNERSLLMSVTIVLDDGFTELMKWWASWSDQKNIDDIEVKFNKDFMLDDIGAREFRALILMYQEGILPIEPIHEVFQRINIIPDTMSLEDFKKALDDPKEFPNNPDIKAKKEGYPDSKSKFSHDEAILADSRREDQSNSNDSDEE